MIDHSALEWVNVEFGNLTLYRRTFDGYLANTLDLAPYPSRLMLTQKVSRGQPYLDLTWLFQGQSKATVNLGVLPHTSERLTTGMRVRDVPGILKQYNLRYALIKQSAPSEKTLLQAAGFRRAFSTADYSIFSAP